MQQLPSNVLSDFLDSIEKRLTNLEIILGASDDGTVSKNITSQIEELQRILLDIYQKGSRYMSNILVLLDIFLLNENALSVIKDEELAARKNIVISCQEELGTLVKRIESLKFLYERSILGSKPHNYWSRKELLGECSGLEQLPDLIEECKRLVFNSIAVCQKFVDYTVLCNEFLIAVGEHLK